MEKPTGSIEAAISAAELAALKAHCAEAKNDPDYNVIGSYEKWEVLPDSHVNRCYEFPIIPEDEK